MTGKNISLVTPRLIVANMIMKANAPKPNILLYITPLLWLETGTCVLVQPDRRPKNQS